MIQSFIQIVTAVFACQKVVFLHAASYVAVCLQWAAATRCFPPALCQTFHIFLLHIPNAITHNPNNFIPQQLQKKKKSVRSLWSLLRPEERHGKVPGIPRRFLWDSCGARMMGLPLCTDTTTFLTHPSAKASPPIP